MVDINEAKPVGFSSMSPMGTRPRVLDGQHPITGRYMYLLVLFIHLFTYSLIYLVLLYLFIYLFVCSFIHFSIHPSIYFHSFIHSVFIHPVFHSTIQSFNIDHSSYSNCIFIHSIYLFIYISLIFSVDILLVLLLYSTWPRIMQTLLGLVIHQKWELKWTLWHVGHLVP